jgi:hypothetical protein
VSQCHLSKKVYFFIKILIKKLCFYDRGEGCSGIGWRSAVSRFALFRGLKALKFSFQGTKNAAFSAEFAARSCSSAPTFSILLLGAGF